MLMGFETALFPQVAAVASFVTKPIKKQSGYRLYVEQRGQGPTPKNPSRQQLNTPKLTMIATGPICP